MQALRVDFETSRATDNDGVLPWPAAGARALDEAIDTFTLPVRLAHPALSVEQSFKPATGEKLVLSVGFTTTRVRRPRNEIGVFPGDPCCGIIIPA